MSIPGPGTVFAYALNIGVALLASRFAKSKLNNIRANDFAPTTLCSQGAMVPLLIGRRRIGALMADAWDLKSSPGAGVRSGKGSKRKRVQGGSQNPTYSESGWHLICVGPATKIHRIWEAGKVIWPLSGEPPLNSTDDPSGTVVQLPNGDEFEIYWGELNQPASAKLAPRQGDANFGGLCHLVWRVKGLGPQPSWKTLDYDMECEVHEDHIACSAPYIAGPPAGVNPAHALAQLLLSKFPYGAGMQDTIDGELPACSLDETIVTGTLTTVLSTTLGGFDADASAGSGPETVVETDTLVVAVEGWYFLDPNPASANPSNIYVDTGTRPDLCTLVSARITLTKGAEEIVLLEDDTSFLLSDGQDHGCYPYEPAPFGGGDIWVRGYARNYIYLTAGVWDFEATIVWNRAVGYVGPVLCDYSGQIYPTLITVPVEAAASPNSFCAFAAEAVTDVVPCSILVTDGEEIGQAVGKIMQDYGIFLSWSPAAGAYQIVRVRKPTEKVVVPADAILPPLLDIETVDGIRPADRLLFQFNDQDRQYRQSTIAVDEDGQAFELEVQRSRTVDMPTIINYAVAAKVAQRRSQEELSGGSTFKIEVGRAGKILYAGQVVEVPGAAMLLRVLEVQGDLLSPRTKIVAVPDYYGVLASEHDADGDGGGSGGGGGATPVADVAFAILEVPAHLLGAGPPAIVVPRIRDNDSIVYADIHLSPDGITYQNIARQFDLQAGGALLEAMGAGDWLIESGPTFTAQGPDIDNVEDYTADEASWCSGRQLAVIGDEIFYLRNVEPVAGTTYRLRGLRRARYDTIRATHAIGDRVFIFSFAEIQDLVDPLLVPGQVLRVKAQPFTGAGGLSLAAVGAVTRTLIGKGIVPMTPGSFRVTAPADGVLAFRTGEDVGLAWHYRSTQTPNTGAGLQGGGVAVGQSDLVGEFELRFYSLAMVLKRTRTTTLAGYVYPNALLVTDFGAEQSFVVELRHVNGGFRSSAVSRTVVLL